MSGAIFATLRAAWRNARSVRGVSRLIEATDRAWWAYTIRRADLVDVEFVVAQGYGASRRRAVRAYVRGGFRTGMTLNPLISERLVSSQLSDAGRVPALYAYVVNDTRSIRTSVSWDAPAYALAHPESLNAPGGPLGHAWRTARARGSMQFGVDSVQTLPWSVIHDRAARAARRARAGSGDLDPIDALTTHDVIVCRLSSGEHDAAAALETTARVAAGLPSCTVVVAVAGRSADQWTSAALMSLHVSSAHVVADRAGLLEGLADDSCGRGALVVRGPDAQIEPDDLEQLAALGASGPVMPLWLAPDGTVAAAGVVQHDGRSFPLLRDHPEEDARALGTRIETSGIAGGTFARPLTRPARGPCITALQLTVRAPLSGRLESMHAAPETAVSELVAPLGLVVADWSSAGPVLRRPRRETRLEDGTIVPALRWAIKIAAPPGTPGEAWGDTHFARGLGAALRRLGQEVVIDAYAARRRPTGHLDDVVLALRGPEPIEPQAGARSLIWIISHPDEIAAAELEGFDAVFAGSSSWAADATRRFGRHVEPLLQCTDALRFRPIGAPRSDDVVFVGTARGIPRPSIIEPVRAGIPVKVYGPDWRGWIPASAIAGRGIPNADLPLVYETASVVLNDHWPAMKAAGFVSNRLFDVVAAGGRAVSDSVEGIPEIFDGAVRTYETVPELIELLRRDRTSVFPDEATLARISARVRAEHSFDARARSLLQAAVG